MHHAAKPVDTRWVDAPTITTYSAMKTIEKVTMKKSTIMVISSTSGTLFMMAAKVTRMTGSFANTW